MQPRRSAKSLLESWVVAHGVEVAVSARVFAEPRQELDGPSEMVEGLVARVTGECCEAGGVVVQARVIGHEREGFATASNASAYRSSP